MSYKYKYMVRSSKYKLMKTMKQSNERTNPILRQWVSDLELCNTITKFMITAVSYTHLDVYKRQLLVLKTIII